MKDQYFIEVAIGIFEQVGKIRPAIQNYRFITPDQHLFGRGVDLCLSFFVINETGLLRKIYRQAVRWFDNDRFDQRLTPQVKFFMADNHWKPYDAFFFFEALARLLKSRAKSIQ